eukprot:TRINITY_DN1675_c0_g1_i10.p1 TRINITY_DN1675_c0_g1~~TRINITY_DN1675_c0_g1_i10.p1  ORF type:complete len:346 (+),score=70.98 TRINITY_DN1675_c0_g1_i10:105-1142(+)
MNLCGSSGINAEYGGNQIKQTTVVLNKQTVKMKTLWNAKSSGGGSVSLSSWDSTTDGIFKDFDIFLAHATGFCKEVWNEMVIELRKDSFAGKITAADARSHGKSDHEEVLWDKIGEDIHKIVTSELFLSKWHSKPNKLIGIGHSQGGATLTRCEIQSPKTFDALVLIEPVIFPPPRDKRETILSTNAAKRQPTFPSREAIVENYLKKKVFQRWRRQVLEDYIDGAFYTTGEGSNKKWHLSLTPKEEAWIYANSALIDTFEKLHLVQVPVLLVYGSDSDFTLFFPPDWWTTLKGKFVNSPFVKLVEVKNASHLLSMEVPDVLSKIVLDFMDDLKRLETQKSPQSKL